MEHTSSHIFENERLARTTISVEATPLRVDICHPAVRQGFIEQLCALVHFLFHRGRKTPQLSEHG